MQCPRCQRENRPGAKFCDECGTPFRDLVETAHPALSYEDLQRALVEGLEQQTATSEILRVISSSPTKLQPVLDAVAERAARLCSADDVNIHLVEGQILRLTAKRGPIPTAETRPITRTRHIGRVVLERRTIHVDDIQARFG
jgi:two-component system, NtrC family, sensor kinase